MPRARMDPAIRERLAEHFKSDVSQLSKLLDRDLSAWTDVRKPPGPSGLTHGSQASDALPQP